MSDLERLWDDVPVGPAPVDAIVRTARADQAAAGRRRVPRPLTRVAVLGGIAAAFVAGTLVSQPDDGAGPGATTPGGTVPGGLAPAAFHGELQAPESCDDLLAHYVDRGLDLVGPYGWESSHVWLQRGARDDGLRTGRVVDRFSASLSAKTETATSSETGTNVQEAGVDEPDTVKTDGELLVRLRGAELTTYDVTGDASGDASDGASGGAGDEVVELGGLDLGDVHDAELLLAGDTVVVVGNDGTRPAPGAPYDPWGGDVASPQTRVLTVDVADPAAPEVVSTVDYDAALVTARQHGDDVRLVLSGGLPDLDFVRPGRRDGRGTALEANRRLVEESTLEDWLPRLRVDGGSGGRLLDCDRVALPRAELGLGTMAVVGFGVDAPGDVEALGLAGEAPLAYESPDHLYLAASGPGDTGCWDLCTRDTGGSDDGTTHVYGFALDGPGATYLGAGEVEGTVRDRWSIDEHEGVLRLAVGPSSETANENQVVTLRAEGDELVEVGRLGGIGPREQIRSVRWFGDLVLVVTFRQVDPFYAIDLTDQSDPTLLGELKIPGFSSYLHPLGGLRVVGLGEGPQRTDDGRRTWGAQAGLFDVSDLTDPQRLDVVGYGGGSQARAGTDPRQVTWLPRLRTLLTVVERGRTGYVSALRMGGGRMASTMTEVEVGSDVAEVRTVPVGPERVVLVTGEDVQFFDLTGV